MSNSNGPLPAEVLAQLARPLEDGDFASRPLLYGPICRETEIRSVVLRALAETDFAARARLSPSIASPARYARKLLRRNVLSAGRYFAAQSAVTKQIILGK